MMRFFMAMGPFGPILLLISIVILLSSLAWFGLRSVVRRQQIQSS